MGPGLPRSRARRAARRAERNTLLLSCACLAACLAVVGAWRSLAVPVLVAALIARGYRVLPAPERSGVGGGVGRSGEHSRKVTKDEDRGESAR